ncbi:MAG TPA: glycosyltransferase family 4 protein, partial [Pyrinomonadaceae bacterium]|nr:glycosyltransferase family 4 protein [Pyrinomonadaceae bacterium]
MKIAYFSPLNPQPSGISDYSEELLPQLGKHCEIDLFVDGFQPANQTIRSSFACFDYSKYPETIAEIDKYDAVVYHLGNDHRYHSGIMEIARRHRGIIVFHDFALQDFFLGLSQMRNDPSIYIEEVFACHGEQAAREAAESLVHGAVPSLATRPLDFPLNCRLARGAEGIVTHSEWGRARFAAIAPFVPVAHIDMPVNVGGGELQHVDSGSGTVQIANFGLITPGKGIEQALRVLSRLKADHDFHYTLVGAPNSFFDVQSLISKYAMQDRVTVTGHLPLEEFERRIALTDIALNLRERTVGETSASLCRIMAAGVPAIVFNVAAFAELPDDAVVKIDQDEHSDLLFETYLRRLIEDAELRRRIGSNARRHILARHSVATSAERYADFIRDVVARRSGDYFVRDVAHQIATLGLRSQDETVLRNVAQEIVLLTPDAMKNSPPALRKSDTSPPQLFNSAPVTGNGHQRSKNSSHKAEDPGRLPKISGVDYKRAALT